MNFIDFVCPVLRTPSVELLFTLVAYFGHASVGSIVGLLLLAHGFFYDSRRTRRIGIAVLLALLLAGLMSELLKSIIESPKPKLGTSHGSVSGQASAAFALASVLSVAFPPMGPVVYLLAVITALSRLYFRAYFAWSVAGGTAIGLLVGYSTARKLIAAPYEARFGPLRFVAWLGVVAFGIAGFVFFNFIDRNIRSHLVISETVQATPAIISVNFGTADARNLFRFGWSNDEKWFDGKQSVVWAHGRASALTIALPAARDYRFRLRVLPYSPEGVPCQRVEVKLNGSLVAKLLLERGWRSYDFKVPQAATRQGQNDVEFYYDHAESPISRKRSTDQRTLSVAFDRLDIYRVREP